MVGILNTYHHSLFNACIYTLGFIGHGSNLGYSQIRIYRNHTGSFSTLPTTLSNTTLSHTTFSHTSLSHAALSHTHTTLSRATLSHTTLSRRISLSHTHFACNFVAHISLTRNVVTHNIPQLCRTQSMPHATPLHATSLSLSLRVWRALLACACSRVRRGPLPSRFCCLGPARKTTALPIVASRLRRRVRWQCPGHAPGAVAGSGLPPLMCSCRPAKGRHETLLGCPTACKKGRGDCGQPCVWVASPRPGTACPSTCAPKGRLLEPINSREIQLTKKTFSCASQASRRLTWTYGRPESTAPPRITAASNRGSRGEEVRRPALDDGWRHGIKGPHTPQVNFFQELEKVVEAARRERRKGKGDGGGSIVSKV